MEFGFDVPNMHHGLGLEAYVGGADIKSLAIDPETFDRLLARVEEIGFHTMWIADHVVFPDSSSVAHPLGYQANTVRRRRHERAHERPLRGSDLRSARVLGYLGGRTRGAGSASGSS